MSKVLLDELYAVKGRTKKIPANTHLFHQKDRVTSLIVVKNGLVELLRDQADGYSIILQRASDDTILAEASMYSKRYHCAAIAVQASEVYMIQKKDFFTKLKQNSDFSHLWAEQLAKEVQQARYRIEILSRKTVAAKLDGWLAWHGTPLTEKGSWKNIAIQLGVTPEALYRELARRPSNTTLT